MKIAFTASGTSWESKIDPRFGRAEFLVIYDEANGTLSSIDNSSVKNEAHGAGTATAQKIFEISPDVLITGNGPGDHAATALRLSKMKILVNAHDMTLKQAYEQYQKGLLNEF
jgi:predicted Fe-Mo cluster-binding NifX family protein